MRVSAVDLADVAALDAFVSTLADPATVPDVLVNNAGHGGAGAFAGVEAAVHDSMLRVNVVAPTRLMRAVLPGMRARGSGRILNVASTAAFAPGPWHATYYATKAYLLSLSEGVSEELRGSGVTVTALCPGPTLTGFAERAGQADSRLFRRGLVMTADVVADAGVRGTLQGRPLVIPGLRNAAWLALQRVLPRRVARRIVARVQRGRVA